MNPIKIVLVDDHKLFRKGIAALLQTQPGLSIVGEAGRGDEAISIIQRTIPQVVLLDIHMPGQSGLQTLKDIKSLLPQTHVIMLTISDDNTDLFTAIKYGADGYLSKNLEPSTLVEMIHGVCHGQAALTPELAMRILKEFRREEELELAPEGLEFESLTHREVEILESVVAGLTNQEIAAQLNISENTVKTHFSNILTKLHLKNRVQAAVYAIREGLVE